MRRPKIAAIAAFTVAVAGLVTAPAANAQPSPLAADGKVTLVRVEVTDAGQAERLAGTDLDIMTIRPGRAQLLLYGPSDERRLRTAGFVPTLLVADVAAANRRARAAEDAQAVRGERSGLPTGRVTYRTLSETNDELRRIAARYPDRVRRFKLPHKSLLGTDVYGLEISNRVHASGHKPSFLLTGMHHSREWPTVDLTMEFAWDMLKNDYRDRRVTSLLDRAKLVVVPIVNPDGYEMSRSLVQEQKRKNCRVEDGKVPTREQCADPANFAKGVDLNRNYGAFWGGPGAGFSTTTSNYRGAAPFSEPEIQNMRALLTSRQITVAISNHTPDARVLRAPSAPNEPTPAEEAAYDALGRKIAGHTGWQTGPWPEVYYDASGTTEEMAFYSSGTFAFTFENTPGHEGAYLFHPEYKYVVDQYLGTGIYKGSNVREAFLAAFEGAADRSLHSVIRGKAPAGRTLTITKPFTLDSSAVRNPDGTTGPALPVPTTVTSSMFHFPGGRFSWDVNPSLRPSQYESVLLPESWTLTCSAFGKVRKTVTVSVARGQTAEADLRGC
ncbi:M14 family zinc carboxypeptidase [Actinomadura fulvescens]|uniref:Peptidase M14 domain-containing protein n=1 Tax=Actinomadura fulvescens TaxID=46160 RepID=A0ABN3PJ40_9ACTN